MITQGSLSGNQNELQETIDFLRLELQQSKALLLEKNQAILGKDSIIENLNHRLALALRHRYASRREKLAIDDGQMNLFDEAELAALEQEDGAATTEDDAGIVVTVKTYKRKKSGRKPLPKDLPRIRKEYDISDSEKSCACFISPRKHFTPFWH